MINNDKQRIIDLFNDCNIEIYPDEQKINYYKNGYCLGIYNLKNETFNYDWFYISKFIDNVSDYVRDYELTINDLLKPIIEEIIKRKVTTIIC